MEEKKAFTIDLLDNGEYQPLLEGTPQTHGMRSGRVHLKPGDECGQHSTKGHEELLTFLNGQGTAVVGEENITVGKGKVAYIPPHTEHNITNTGSEPLVYIYCVAPIQE